MYTIFTNPAQPTQTINGKFEFTGIVGQTEFQNDDMIGASMVTVSTEKGLIQEGSLYDKYTFDPSTGTIDFNQSIEDQRIIVLWFKTVS